MSIRSHILLMFAATVAAWLSWLLVIANINPQQTQWWGFAAFYGSFFLSLFGTFSLLGFIARSVLRKRVKTAANQTSVSLRQAFFWALALILALFLQGERLLSWWLMLIIFVLFALLEFFFGSLQRQPVE